MKYVSFLFAVALIGFAGLAHASEQKSFNFDYSSNQSFFACSYVEGQASKVLTTLGAENVKMNCYGGIQYGQWLPVALSATFTIEEKGARTVVLRGRDACDMNVKLIKTILTTVDHEVLSSSYSCWGSTGQYKFEIALK